MRIHDTTDIIGCVVVILYIFLVILQITVESSSNIKSNNLYDYIILIHNCSAWDTQNQDILPHPNDHQTDWKFLTVNYFFNSVFKLINF